MKNYLIYSLIQWLYAIMISLRSVVFFITSSTSLQMSKPAVVYD